MVAGQLKAAEVGNEVLRKGGNAIDAAVAAALTAAVAAPQQCGIGGYGGHMMIALAPGKKITAIDFNSAAPSAARSNMFAPDEEGKVPGQINEYGWMAAGVPGPLAGLHLALSRYGTRSFRELAAPAIELASEGFAVTEGLARSIGGVAGQLRKDAASMELLFRNGEPLAAGETLRNPDLAKMLEQLARDDSVESFYQGDIAKQIAEEFRKHGGLVTTKDLADYKAREVTPLDFGWNGFSIRTAPLTAGGLTALEALAILKALGWQKFPADPTRTQALVEALRIGWQDRLTLLGDPEKTAVPIQRLLSAKYAQAMASTVRRSLSARQPLPFEREPRLHTGTVHLNCADARGNMVALTLTHGNSFGACVTVQGLGLTLGHGMSRFDPFPSHPNAPGPGKRPLHNMCPTILLRDGRPVLALGGTGGRLIPSAVFSVLSRFMGLSESIEEAVAAPRLHTEGNLTITVEKNWPEAELDYLKNAGYKLKTGGSATVHALSRDLLTGACRVNAR
jgi:gamma-glutamyltranspeptidase/glutathione hydrolase